MDPKELAACVTYAWEGFRPIANDRAERFLGKVEEDTARCRGGDKAVNHRQFPWVDWQNYWATGDSTTKAPGLGSLFGKLGANGRGIRGALLDLEYQRMEMIKFNLFDNSGTYREYASGLRDPAGALKYGWKEMRVPEKSNNPDYADLWKQGLRVNDEFKDKGAQECTGDLIRFRTTKGFCNDVHNPLMGSTNQPLARNVQFEATTFLDLKDEEKSAETMHRHAKRLDLLRPDPQLISRKLFTRDQQHSVNCNEGQGPQKAGPGTESAFLPPTTKCPYQKAPFFNVLAAFWIQFMTHDWFSHLEEGSNSPELMTVGCAQKRKTDGNYEALSQAEIERLKCRPHDRIGKAVFDKTNFSDKEEKFFTHEGEKYLTRASKTTLNNVTAWWDASQIYGYDDRSWSRVKKDPKDLARLDMPVVSHLKGEGDAQGYLPSFDPSDPINAAWEGQEATAFPDNWSIGLSFLHNVFAREHNAFVRAFRDQNPDKDSGLRNPAHPDTKILYKDVADEDLFQIARLVVSAEIAKIHTIEWTTQLLYNDALYRGMNANWSGLAENFPMVSSAIESVMKRLKESGDASKSDLKYSAFAGGAGIFGLGNEVKDCWHVFFCPDEWTLRNLDHVNGGTHHFGSPFNFPEEFITVYRLHPLVPDLLEYRNLEKPDEIQMVPVVKTFRKEATQVMHTTGLGNWASSMGRQPLGSLTLFNHPQFLQNLTIAEGRQIDVAALDILRDRERGVPRFNEFRRQYGLKTLTSFDDFIDKGLVELAEKNPEMKAELYRQRDIAKTLREVYGTHLCDGSTITTAQKRWVGTEKKGKWVPIDDCFGQEYGTEVDNIEDVDTVVGWLAEPVRPHGFAISETQFQVFILNASRRLFSDRFFTSSFRKEFYSNLGIEWVMNNGPARECGKTKWVFGFEVDRSPLKCVLRRTIPELKPELEHVVNVFDPWGRDRGEYYSLQ